MKRISVISVDSFDRKKAMRIISMRTKAINDIITSICPDKKSVLDSLHSRLKNSITKVLPNKENRNQQLKISNFIVEYVDYTDELLPHLNSTRSTYIISDICDTYIKHTEEILNKFTDSFVSKRKRI